MFRGERILLSIDRQCGKFRIVTYVVCVRRITVFSAAHAERGIIMKKTNIRKLAVAAVLVAAAVAGSLFSFPFLGAKCSPVQHLVNIIGGVYLGPWYSLGMAFCASLIRNIFGLGSPLAFPGSMVGAFLCGAMYHWVFKGKSQALRLPMAYVGELFGTSVIGGMLSFPIAYLIMNNTAATLFGFVFPFFASSVVGTVIAAILVTSLKRVKAIDIFLGDINKNSMKLSS